MQIKAANPTLGSACQGQMEFGTVSEASVATVDHDVSIAAQRFLISAPVFMDAEAFGVTVSRRPQATPAMLTNYEMARLLDVLSHAQVKVHESPEGESEFPMWLVSSDCRDAQPRVVWLIISRHDGTGYRISLSDL